MKTLTIRQLLALGLLGLCALAPAQAQEKKVPGPTLTLTVGTIRDLGGASAYKGPDNKPLPERLAQALKTFLMEGAKARYAVTGGITEAPKGAPRFVIEGDLSAIEVGTGERRPYMLVTRLYKDDKPRRLVAQFAGTAQSVRDLVGNLTNQPGAGSKMGLLGAMSRELADAALGARTSGEDFDEMVKAATAQRRITVDVMSENTGDQKPRQQVLSGESFRLRVNSQDAGQVYVVMVDASGRARTPYAQSEPLDVAPGQPVTLPPNSPFIAPKVTQPTPLEFIIFVRKRAGAPKVAVAKPKVEPAKGTQTGIGNLDVGGTQTGTGSLDVGGTQTGTGGLDVRGAVRGTRAPGDAIELLTCTSPLTARLDAGVEALLELFKDDPQGSWIGVRVKINIAPTP